MEAARQIVPDDAGVEETSRLLQKQLLERAATAATAGNAADTERWLANADSVGAPRPEMTAIRRSLQDTLIGARAARMNSLTQSFAAALAANRLVQPANDNAKVLSARADQHRRQQPRGGVRAPESGKCLYQRGSWRRGAQRSGRGRYLAE